jgi:predicted nucleic acid-binding protein
VGLAVTATRTTRSTNSLVFLTSLADGDLTAVDLDAADWRRAADPVTTYSDLPLGAVDASLVAVAERLEVAEIATIDCRHFSVVRPRYIGAFPLLPQ